MKSFFASLYLFVSSLFGVSPEEVVPPIPQSPMQSVQDKSSENNKNVPLFKNKTPYIIAGSQMKLDIQGGVMPYSFEASKGSLYAHKISKNDFYYRAPLEEGEMILTVTDSLGNKDTLDMSVVSPLMVSVITRNMTTQERVTVQVRGGMLPYVYQIAEGVGIISDTGLFTPLEAGKVIVLVEDKAGQQGVITLTVSVPENKTIPSISTVPYSPPAYIPPTSVPDTSMMVQVPVVNPVKGVCGLSHGATLTSAPSSDFCQVGTVSPVVGTGPWSWTCDGIDGGASAFCRSELVFVPIPVNGTCGTAEQVAVYTIPTQYLCIASPPSLVTGSGPWYWTCPGANGGSEANCQAPLAQ